MATTWMKALHKNSGNIAAVLDMRIEYAKNFEKTNGGELIEGYECDPFTAQSEFLFSKRLYERKTGRDQGKHDVLAYHIRMSFKPGEVTAEQALALGRELAIRWTRGKHQFIVAAHTNTQNPHTHIIFNSVNLNCDGKFQDFKCSAIALRRVSDQICLEHGLSIIEKPGLSKGYNRNEYLGENKSPTVRNQLRDLMDTALSGCKDFDSFISALETAGVEIKHGKQLSFRLPGGKKFSRQDTLGEDYTEATILERISGKRIVAPKSKISVPVVKDNKPSLFIDIQSKMQQGKGEGYRHWATIFNLKEMSKTLIFLNENDITDYDDLVKKSVAVSGEYNKRLTRIKDVEKHLDEISQLQKHIGTYSKTREVYAQYRASGWDSDFYETHRADITLHKAAKKYFDDQGFGKNKKLPPMQSLKQEYATLFAEKKKLYSGWSELKENRKALLVARGNVERILDIDKNSAERDVSHRQKRNDSHDR